MRVRFQTLLLSAFFCLVAGTSFTARSFPDNPDDLMTYLNDCPEEAVSQAETTLDSLDTHLDSHGRTLLMYACIQGCYNKMVAALLDKGVDPNGGARDYCPVKMAVAFECDECLALLINYGALKAHSRNELLLYLNMAIEKNNHQQVEMLIESDAQMLMDEARGETALFTMLELNCMVSPELLLGYLQLHHPEAFAQQLTELPNSKAYLGSVLAYAAFMEHDEAVRLLIRFGARIYSEDSHGRTALMVLASEQRLEGVRLLLRHGADINRPNSADFTPVEEAFNRWDYPALRVIKMAGGDFSSVEGHFFCFWNAYRKIFSFDRYLSHYCDLFSYEEFIIGSLGLTIGAVLVPLIKICRRCSEPEISDKPSDEQPVRNKKNKSSSRRTHNPQGLDRRNTHSLPVNRFAFPAGGGELVEIQQNPPPVEVVHENDNTPVSQNGGQEASTTLTKAVRDYIASSGTNDEFIKTLEGIKDANASKELSPHLKAKLKKTMRERGLKADKIPEKFNLSYY